MPQSFFDIIKDDGKDDEDKPQSIEDYLSESRARQDAERASRKRTRIEESRRARLNPEQIQIGTGIDWNDPKNSKEKKLYEELTQEIKEVVELSKAGRETTTADFYKANSLLSLNNDSKRASKLKGFNIKYTQGGHLPQLQKELQTKYGRTTHYSIWLKEIGKVFGSTSLGAKSLRRIGQYIMSPQKDEMVMAEQVIDWAEEAETTSSLDKNNIQNREFISFKNTPSVVEEYYEEILDDLTEAVRIINRYENIAETAMENKKVLEMALDTDLEDDTKIKTVLSEIKLAIREYKTYIKQRYGKIKIYWRALKILNGRDKRLGIPQKHTEDLFESKTIKPAKYKTISPAEYEDTDDPYKRTKDAVREMVSDKEVEETQTAKKGEKIYNFPEINPSLIEDYLELARYTARDFIEDLGHEIDIDSGEVKAKLDKILSRKSHFKALKEE